MKKLTGRMVPLLSFGRASSLVSTKSRGGNLGKAQGPIGATGATGATGAAGAQGAQGLPGEPGAQGLQSDPGPQGTPGDPGPQGPPGEVTFTDMTNAISNTASNVNGVGVLGLTGGDSTTQAIIDKLNELITALYR